MFNGSRSEWEAVSNGASPKPHAICHVNVLGAGIEILSKFVDYTKL